jgi:hypothetical protein
MLHPLSDRMTNPEWNWTPFFVQEIIIKNDSR